MSGGRPIFIAGPARSGTTLLRSILNKHPDVWISDETYYFDNLRLQLAGAERGALAPAQRDACERFFRPLLAHEDRLLGVEREDEERLRELRALALEAGDGADAYFETFCRLGSDRRGRGRWGEKTPRNVFRLDELFSFAPDAHVVCLLRDPRAVVASYRDHRARGAEVVSDWYAAERRRLERMYHPILVSLVWKAAVAAAFRARERYGRDRVYVERYEQLVTSPEPSIRRLTDWLGIEFAEAMLEVDVIGSSYVAGYRGESGFSQKSLRRWEQTLSPRDVAAIQSCCRRFMRELAYEQLPVHGARLRAARAWAGVPFASVRALAANKGRIADARSYVTRRLALAARRPASLELG